MFLHDKFSFVANLSVPVFPHPQKVIFESQKTLEE